MKLEKGDMWRSYGFSDLFFVTANSSIDSKDQLVMDEQVKVRYPYLPYYFGGRIKDKSFYGIYIPWERLAELNEKICLFQTQDDWKNPSTLKMIFKSTYMLLEIAEKYPSMRIDLNFPELSKEIVLPILSVLPENVHVWEKE